MAPLIRYHKEVWLNQFPNYAPKDLLNVKELSEAFEQARNHAILGAWDQGGPIALAIKAAKEVGWTFVNAFTLKDPNGGEIDLWSGSPTMLKQTYVQAWRAKHEEQISDRLIAKYSNLGGGEQMVSGLTLLPFRKALRKKNLNPKQALIIKGLALDKLPTGAQQIKRGIAVHAPCPLCGDESDDYYHRVVECTNPDAVGLRTKIDPGYLKEVIKGGRNCVRGQVLTCTRVTGFTRTDVLTNILEQEDWGGLEETPEHFCFDPDKPLYADGSCYRGSDPDFAATGLRVA